MGLQRNESRKGWIDIVKGFLILLVIFGHATTNKNILNCLSSFYMPAFFIISGWLIKKEGNIKLFIRKKVKGVLFPYFFFAIIWVLFCFVKNFIIKSDFNLFYALLSIILPYSGSVGGNAYNLWFLPCLFLSQVLIAMIINEKIICKIIACIVWLIFFVLGVFFTPYCSLLYATSIASIFVGFGYFVNTYLLHKLLQKSKKIVVLLVIFCVVIYAICLNVNVFLLKNTLDFSSASFGILALYVVGGLCGSIFLIGLLSKVKSFAPIEYIGRNSLVYYALHYEVLAVIGYICSKIINAHTLFVVIVFIFTVVITTLVVLIYNKLNIGKLFK